MISPLLHVALLVWAACLAVLPAFAGEFEDQVRPVLAEYCGDCHSPGSSNRAPFLAAATESDMLLDRATWRNVAMQLRNRTMPPVDPQPTERDRLRISAWIDRTLRATACDLGEHAGAVTARRLNRAEYENTVRDLFGLRFELAELFPVDGSGGEGFDNHADTLYLSPLLLERYLEVADRVLQAVIVTPPLGRSFTARGLLPGRPADEHDSVWMEPGDDVTFSASLYEDAEYRISSWIRSPGKEERPELNVFVDGKPAGKLSFAWSLAQATPRSTILPVSQGDHRVRLAVAEGSPALRLVSVDLDQQASEPDDGKLAAHFRLFGREPGEPVLDPRREAERLLKGVARKAFRRPLRPGDLAPYLDLFDRSAGRGAPFEVSVRLALKAVLVSPDFLFRVEGAPRSPGIQRLSGHELATRLSYFLWGTMPDAELAQLADLGRLHDDEVLAGQADRLIDHPRSRFFARAFMGQWLGTKDVGGRVAPTLNEIQHFYTPHIAADMREEPVLLFQRMLREDRSLLDFLAADYTFLTERLARHYGMEGVAGNQFRLVEVSDGRRGGLLGLGAVQAMNSEYKRTSPVLRGVWVLDALLGTRIPAPPPDIPSLEQESEAEGAVPTIREMMARHRADPSCAACHDLIDPIGFAFEHYDWLGRWRDEDDHGRPVDASGTLPTGEAFEGLHELRQALLSRKDEFIRHVARKILGYALGRAVSDADHCVLERIVARIEDGGFGARSLVREIVLSTPFRFTQASRGSDPSGD